MERDGKELTAVERLRELLDARGVEYTTEDLTFIRRTSWHASNGEYVSFYEYPSNGSTKFDYQHFTPEQAIAATLGSDRIAELEAENERLKSALGKPLILRPCDAGESDYARAATLGAGECENVIDPPDGFLCSVCGWGDFSEPSHLLTSACYKGGGVGPNYCPNCGAKVRKAVER